MKHSDFEAASSLRTPSPNADTVIRPSKHKNLLHQSTQAALAAKRKWPRFAVNMSVEVRVVTQGPTRVVACKGHGTDISVGGLGVTADIDLPVGAQVGVEFTLPHSDHSLMCRCFVRNLDRNCYGMEFITENDEDYRKIGELQQYFSR